MRALMHRRVRKVAFCLAAFTLTGGLMAACYEDWYVLSEARTIDDSTANQSCVATLTFAYKGVGANFQSTWTCVTGRKIVQLNDRMGCTTTGLNPTKYKCNSMGDTIIIETTQGGGCKIPVSASEANGTGCSDRASATQPVASAKLTPCPTN